MSHSRFVRYIEGFFGERYHVNVEVREVDDQPLLITVLDFNSRKRASIGTTALNALDVSSMLEMAAELKFRTA